MTTFRITLSNGEKLTMDGTAGPLSDFDCKKDDPLDFAEIIWKWIDSGDPIWLENGQVVYLNRAHVVYLSEA